MKLNWLLTLIECHLCKPRVRIHSVSLFRIEKHRGPSPLACEDDIMWAKFNFHWAKFNFYLGKIQLSLTAILPLEYAAILLVKWAAEKRIKKESNLHVTEHNELDWPFLKFNYFISYKHHEVYDKFRTTRNILRIKHTSLMVTRIYKK